MFGGEGKKKEKKKVDEAKGNYFKKKYGHGIKTTTAKKQIKKLKPKQQYNGVSVEGTPNVQYAPKLGQRINCGCGVDLVAHVFILLVLKHHQWAWNHVNYYSESFAANLVDARMLEHLSKKELEKFLGVTRKFHQASVVHGIHLLRIMKYDRQALAVRRHQCENVDADPLVWTNQRFIRWARNIDLGEYADNLKDSGVHGGLVVLEPSFNGDTMATALGIPASKNIIRRHLTAELEGLVLPARYVVFCQMEELHGVAPTKHNR